MRLYDEQGRLLVKAAPHASGDLTDFPANQADGFLKRNAGNAAWEEVPYGTAANTVCQGNDVRLGAGIEGQARVFGSLLPNMGTSLTLTSDQACFTYLGRTLVDLTPKFVEFFVMTGGTGGQVAEVGLFSSASGPGKAGLSLVKLVSTGTVDALTSVGVKRNTAAFATVVVGKGTHLWAGLRTAMGTTQPAISALCLDMNEGRVQVTAGAGVLTAAGPWTGSIPAQVGAYANTALGVDLRVTLD